MVVTELLRKTASLICVTALIVNSLAPAVFAGVGLANGDYSYESVDLAVGGQYPIQLVRQYQSPKTDGTVNVSSGPFGPSTNMGFYSLKASLVTSDNVTKVQILLPSSGKALFVPTTTPNVYKNATPYEKIQGTVTVTAAAMTLELSNGGKFIFDTNNGGKLSTVTDRYNKSFAFQYNGDFLSRITDPFGRFIELTYSTTFLNQIASARLYAYQGSTLYLHSTVYYEYDPVTGDLRSFKNGMGNEYKMEYQNHYLKKVIRPDGIVAIQLDWNTANPKKVVKELMPGLPGDTTDDMIRNYDYQVGRTIVKDSNNVENTYDIDTKTRVKKQTAPDGGLTEYTYDETTDEVLTSKNYYNQMISYTYQGSGGLRYLEETKAPDNTRSYSYYTGPFGKLERYVDANGNRTVSEFLNDEVDATFTLEFASPEINYTPIRSSYYDSYNDYGQILQTRDGQGRIVQFDYDNYQNLISSINVATGIGSCYMYDRWSRLVEQYSCSVPTEKKVYGYDKLNRITTINKPGGKITEFVYDDNSQVRSITAPNGITTTYIYNEQGFVISRKEGVLPAESFTYNNLGLVKTYTDRNQNTVTYTYDNNHRLDKVTFQDSKYLQYSYNKLNQVESITDSSEPSGGKNITFTYALQANQIPRLTNVQTGTPQTSGHDNLRYTYDNVGNVKKVERINNGFTDGPVGELLGYDYAEDNSLKSATLYGRGDGTNLTVSFTYNQAGELTGLSYPGLASAFTYTDLGNLQQVKFSVGQTVLRQLDYVWDYQNADPDRGLLSSRSESGNDLSSIPRIARQQQFTYNGEGELTLTQTDAGQFNVNYDLGGNPSTINNAGKVINPTYVSGTNRMNGFDGRSVATDANGNITSDGANKYIWNIRNQLVSITDMADSVKATFTYDALGRRISKTVNGATTRFVYAGNQVIEEVTSTARKRYLVALSMDSVLASRIVPMSGTASTEYYLKDALNGSVIAAVDAATLTVKTGYGYTPFGKVTRVQPTTATTLGAEQAWTTNPYYGQLSNHFADVTGDGKADAIVINLDKVTVRRSTGSSFSSSNESWTDNPFYGTSKTAFADVDGDGRADAIAVNSSNIGVRRSLGSSFGDEASTQDWVTGNFIGSKGNYFVDVTGDGRADAVAVYDTSIQVRPSTGTNFGPAQTWSGAFYGTRGTYFADIDGDARADAIAVNDSSVSVLRANASGTSFGNVEAWTGEPYFGSVKTIFADVDGDGRADVIAINDSNIAIRRTNGATFIQNEALTAESYAGDRDTFFADVTGDGRADGIALNNSNVKVRPAQSLNGMTPSANTLTFTGREEDGTGLYYYRARYYSPELQRFISQDPLGFLGGDTNLYRYVGNTPNTSVDPTGLQCLNSGGASTTNCDDDNEVVDLLGEYLVEGLRNVEEYVVTRETFPSMFQINVGGLGGGPAGGPGGGGGGGGASPPKNPKDKYPQCKNVKSSDLNYGKVFNYDDGVRSTAYDHIKRHHGSYTSSIGSYYMVGIPDMYGYIRTYLQGDALMPYIIDLNASVFDNPDSVRRNYGPDGFVFEKNFASLSSTEGGTVVINSIGRDRKYTQLPTSLATLILQMDCKSAVTSTPGKP